MKLGELRRLKWQIAATLSLFVACVPLAGAVILLRDRFERHMFEDYKARHEEFSDELQALIDAADSETPARDLKTRIAALELETKERIFQDWMRRREPQRLATPARLVSADADFFLKRAEKAVVCGNEEQRERALTFLIRSEAAGAAEIVDRLATWARKRRRGDIVEQVERFRTGE